MDKDEKLAKARKKLKRFQAQSSPDGSPRGRRKAPATPPSEVPVFKKDGGTSTPEEYRRNLHTHTHPHTLHSSHPHTSQEMSDLFSKSSVSVSLPVPEPLPRLHNHTHPPFSLSPHLHNGATPPHQATPPPPSHSRTPSLDQVQVHAKTIDILVSEKADLEGLLSALKASLAGKERQCADMAERLRAMQTRLDGAERQQQLTVEESDRREKVLVERDAEVRGLRATVERMTSLLEEQQQEGTELVSKVAAQSAEVSHLASANTELQSRLNLAELLAEQLSAGAPTPPPDPAPFLAECEELRSETGRLRGQLALVTGERDQALCERAALREALASQQQEEARKLAGAHGRLAEAEASAASLARHLQELQQERESQSEQLAPERESCEVAGHAALREERDQLKRQLQEQIQTNAQLNRLSEEQETQVAVLEEQTRRHREQAVEQQGLLRTISQDKETISRAMSQNKALKGQHAELQDAFVRMSQQNMALASDLETQRHHLAQLTVLLREKEQETGRMEEEEGEGVGEEERGSAKEMESIDGGKQEGVEVEQVAGGREEEEEEEGGSAREMESIDGEGVEEEEGGGAEVAGGTEESSSAQVVAVPEESAAAAAELETLRASFSALEGRFVGVMAEKVSLLERLQDQEHVLVQLASETETIGEYVTLYQLQRDALRSRFAERNTFIGTLLQEKETMQEKIRELQGLVKGVLSEHTPPLSPSHRHTPTLPPHTGTPPPPHQHTSSTSALTSPSTSAPSLSPPPPPPPPPPPSPLPPSPLHTGYSASWGS